jgi:hypothetical protein
LFYKAGEKSLLTLNGEGKRKFLARVEKKWGLTESEILQINEESRQLRQLACSVSWVSIFQEGHLDFIEFCCSHKILKPDSKIKYGNDSWLPADLAIELDVPNLPHLIKSFLEYDILSPTSVIKYEDEVVSPVGLALKIDSLFLAQFLKQQRRRLPGKEAELLEQYLKESADLENLNDEKDEPLSLESCAAQNQLCIALDNYLDGLRAHEEELHRQEEELKRDNVEPSSTPKKTTWEYGYYKK